MIKLINDDSYQKAYNSLNVNQKKAVDHIEDPVLVIAGPGTGKTQLLALRVCNILRITQIDPSNILCLTYTDAGVNAMRSRLVSFMGSAAYQVHLYTFHSFCNKIIRENPEYFGMYKEFGNADELEIIETIMEIFDELPLDHYLKRNTGDYYSDVDKLKSVFEIMKRENWSPQHIAQAGVQYYEELKKDKIYKRNTGGNKVGDINWRDVNAAYDKLKFVLEACPLIEMYNKKLRSQNLIDYADSINFVIEALRKNEDLKYRYQELFQYILIDEFQDTNGAQCDLIFTLCDYEKPNLFIVGDDDQAIYRFQGASMYNVNLFIDRYNPAFYVLTDNYRSHQDILDKATKLIDNNKDRLSNLFAQLDKKLIQKNQNFTTDNHTPVLLKYHNSKAQDVGLLKKINELIDTGEEYKEIAIIYRKHKEVADLISYLTKKNIPLKVKNKVNALIQPDIEKVINLLTYIHREGQYPGKSQDLAFIIMHFDYFKLNPLEVSKLAVYCARHNNEEETKLLWRDVLANEEVLQKIGILNIKGFKAFLEIMESLITAAKNNTLQHLLEMVYTRTGMLTHFISHEQSSWKIQLLSKFMDYLKELNRKDEKLNLERFLQILERRIENRIALSTTNMINSANGINFISAHSSKGLEFKHVYILNAIESAWKESSYNRINFPPTLTQSNAGYNFEDERRLFYVAITRAKEYCTMMLPSQQENGKENGILQFLHEMDYKPEVIEETQIEEELMKDYLFTTLQYTSDKKLYFDKDLVDYILQDFTINPTNLSKYLNCPKKFYFENILRVPKALLAEPGYGKAMHFALQYFVHNTKQSKQTSEDLIRLFEKGMEKYKYHFTDLEFKSYLYEGTEILTNYYDDVMKSLEGVNRNETEIKYTTFVNEVPIAGIIDRIAVQDEDIFIFDYKTASYNSAKVARAKGYDTVSLSVEEETNKEEERDTANIGGDYWRQAVFYNIILRSQPQYKNKKITTNFVYLKKNQSQITRPLYVTEPDIEIVKSQIETVYAKIKNYEFHEGCNTCEWCQFIDKSLDIDQVIDQLTIDEKEEI